MSNQSKSSNKLPAIIGIIAAAIAAFFGISIPTNLFGGGADTASSVPTSSNVESVTSSTSSVKEESSETEITVTSKPETTTTTKTEQTSKHETTTTKSEETSKP